MVKDIIISYKLDEHHFRTLYFVRSNNEEVLTRDELIYTLLNKFIANDTEVTLPDYDALSTLITTMKADSVDETVAALNYIRYYVHVIDRLDVVDTMSTEIADDFAVRVYLMNPDNTAVGIMSQDPQSASTADCIMNMFINKLSIDPKLGEIIKIQFGMDSYDALVKAGSGFEFDATQFYNYITSGNRSLLIFVR